MSDETRQAGRPTPKAERPHMPEGYGVPATDEGLLPWSHVDERLERARNYWVITARKDGRPHAIPIWGAWVDGAVYFEGGTDTRWARNIAENPEVVVHLESGDDVIILEGTVERIVPDMALATKLSEAYGAKYEGYKPTPEQFTENPINRVHPRKALAWSQFPTHATRFRFDGD